MNLSPMPSRVREHLRGSRYRVPLRTVAIAMVAVLTLATPASAQSSLPDPTTTPGATNPAVTQENIHETVCVPGWTRTVRPPAFYTSALKREQIKAAGYADRRPGHYEEDHLIPLVLGGAPYDPRNLWPEPRDPADGWGAGRKDDLEAILADLVCEGQLPLIDAQRAMASDWIAAYRRFFGVTE